MKQDSQLNPSNRHLWLHHLAVALIYPCSAGIVYAVLSLPAAHTNFVTALSSAAIMATFGSAIATLGSLWTGDRAARIALDVDIFFRDILKKEAWRRWPFLLRGGKRSLFGGMRTEFELQNPCFPLNAGSHAISVLVPTVQEDFFDLPLMRNLWPLLRFRTAAHTTIANAEKDSKCPVNGLSPMDQFMAYECLTDVWTSVFIFRVARYVVHFGAALTLTSALVGPLMAATKGLS